MPSRTKALPKVGISHDVAPVRISKIPSQLQFPLVVLLSLALSTALPELARSVNLDSNSQLRPLLKNVDNVETGALLAWRIFVLGVEWFGNYDSMDILALTVLSRGPPLYLLSTFYQIHATEILTSLAFDLLANSLPFALLRQLSPAHELQASPELPNGDIVSDYYIQGITPILGASVYSVTLYSSFLAFLRTSLVTHFPNVVSIASAYPVTPMQLLPTTLPFGVAAKIFIFTPASVIAPTIPRATLDPAKATLSETFWYNAWGFSARTKAVIARTFTLMVVTGGNTFLETFVRMEGVEAVGAAGYSAVWVAAAGLTGVMLGLVSPS